MEIKLHLLPKLLRYTITVFIVVLTFGYFSGLDLLKHTTNFQSKGIEQNVLGNEFDERVDELHFKMSERELMGIIHGHVIPLSILFLVLSLLLYFTTLPSFIKSFLMIEPLVSLMITFGGLWLLWLGYSSVKYLIMISGILMHLSMALIIVFLLKELLFKSNN
jgi:hypothetical protein